MKTIIEKKAIVRILEFGEIFIEYYSMDSSYMAAIFFAMANRELLER